MITKDMENHPGKLPTIQDFLFQLRTLLPICIEFANDEQQHLNLREDSLGLGSQFLYSFDCTKKHALNEQSHAERNMIYTNVNLMRINAMKIYIYV